MRRIFGSVGLTCQRNRGISCLIDKVDLLAFIDDDFIVGDDYFRNMEKIFEQEDFIIGLNADIICRWREFPGLHF